MGSQGRPLGCNHGPYRSIWSCLCAQSSLESMGLRIQKDCILDSTGDGGTYQNLFQKFKGLSANSFSGRGETWLVENGYSERTDYSKNSFFQITKYQMKKYLVSILLASLLLWFRKHRPFWR